MSKTISIQDTITAHPTGIADDHAYASISNQTNGYNESSNTTYATINLTTGSGATTYIYYTFNFSDIPVGATIDSVACTAKAYINTTNSSRITTRQIQLYTGTTAKGIKAVKLKHLLIPFPPFEEQERIVAKLDELLPLCEGLKES